MMIVCARWREPGGNNRMGIDCVLALYNAKHCFSPIHLTHTHTHRRDYYTQRQVPHGGDWCQYVHDPLTAPLEALVECWRGWLQVLFKEFDRRFRGHHHRLWQVFFFLLLSYTSRRWIFSMYFLSSCAATKRVEEEKPLGRWSDHDEEIGEEPDTVDDADNTSLEVTTATHYSFGRGTQPAGASSRRSNNNNNNVQSPTQNKMSIIRSSGAAVRLQRTYYYLVAVVSFFLVVMLL